MNENIVPKNVPISAVWAHFGYVADSGKPVSIKKTEILFRNNVPVKYSEVSSEK